MGQQTSYLENKFYIQRSREYATYALKGILSYRDELDFRLFFYEIPFRSDIRSEYEARVTRDISCTGLIDFSGVMAADTDH